MGGAKTRAVCPVSAWEVGTQAVPPCTAGRPTLPGALPDLIQAGTFRSTQYSDLHRQHLFDSKTIASSEASALYTLMLRHWYSLRTDLLCWFTVTTQAGDAHLPSTLLHTGTRARGDGARAYARLGFAAECEPPARLGREDHHRLPVRAPPRAPPVPLPSPPLRSRAPPRLSPRATRGTPWPSLTRSRHGTPAPDISHRSHSSGGASLEPESHITPPHTHTHTRVRAHTHHVVWARRLGALASTSPTLSLNASLVQVTQIVSRLNGPTSTSTRTREHREPPLPRGWAMMTSVTRPSSSPTLAAPGRFLRFAVL